jgi:hypothetical protein
MAQAAIKAKSGEAEVKHTAKAVAQHSRAMLVTVNAFLALVSLAALVGIWLGPA